ncbi:hypothetical protein EC2770900_2870 [Escherichia coli 2770900]|nr:hypothetical protein EC2770900_2870 [Escherichia coli 2770900]
MNNNSVAWYSGNLDDAFHPINIDKPVTIANLFDRYIHYKAVSRRFYKQ